MLERAQSSAGGHTLHLFHCSWRIPSAPAGSGHFKGSPGGGFSSSDNPTPVKNTKKKKGGETRKEQQRSRWEIQCIGDWEIYFKCSFPTCTLGLA